MLSLRAITSNIPGGILWKKSSETFKQIPWKNPKKKFWLSFILKSNLITKSRYYLERKVSIKISELVTQSVTLFCVCQFYNSISYLENSKPLTWSVTTSSVNLHQVFKLWQFLPKLNNNKTLNEELEICFPKCTGRLGNFLMREVCQQDRRRCWHR